LIKDGKTTYVYCSAGKYRSPQTVALYLILKNGKNVEEAIKFVEERHPVARPNEKVIKKAVYHIRKFDLLKSTNLTVENRAN
jgi:protein-tyrosine phosphatase